MIGRAIFQYQDMIYRKSTLVLSDTLLISLRVRKSYKNQVIVGKRNPKDNKNQLYIMQDVSCAAQLGVQLVEKTVNKYIFQ